MNCGPAECAQVQDTKPGKEAKIAEGDFCEIGLATEINEL